MNQYRTPRQRDARLSGIIDMAVTFLALPIMPVCWFLIWRAFCGI